MSAYIIGTKVRIPLNPVLGVGVIESAVFEIEGQKYVMVRWPDGTVKQVNLWVLEVVSCSPS